MLENTTICLTRARRVRLDNVGEILMMLNCFYVTFYLMRMLLVVIPTADLPIYVTIWAHVLIIAPSVVIVIFLAPMHAKVSPIRLSEECRQPVDPSHCTWGVERRGEFSPLGPGAGCFLALGSGLGLVGTVSARRRKRAKDGEKTGTKWARYGQKSVNQGS